jgi:hypothetical protein
VITEGSVRHLGGTAESLATGVNEAGLAVGRYNYSCLTDHPLAWDAAVDAVADLNADISEDADWTVFEAWDVNGTGQVTGFGTAVIVGIYRQRGDLLTMQCERCSRRWRNQLSRQPRPGRNPVWSAVLDEQTGLLGGRFLAKSLGQVADLGFWVAAVPAEGLQERQLAFLSPARHRLGRDMEEVGHLGGVEVAGVGGCGLAGGLGCHGASLSCGGRRRRCRARSGPGWSADIPGRTGR